ncbi:hypothetical protein BGX24_006063 [Mortierella sp. AD032]|nr:hypothetical protein BGX24_006063 [Mortierella sp. AD032]
MFIDVERILVICPLLETLHVSSSVFSTFEELSASQRKLITTLPDRLPLRSLVLKHPLVAQSWMEGLLARMPNLEVLKLIGLTQVGDRVWDWPRFRKYLKSLYLPLKRFHYSIQLMRSIDEEQEEEIAAVCPNTREPTLSLHGLTPKVIKSLTTQYVVLTTLEIHLNGNALCQGDGWVLNFRDVEPRYTARPLHYLLCEGCTLRHLKILKIPYLVDFMDLHRRYTHFMTYEEIQSLSTLNVPSSKNNGPDPVK